jgi:hypothetical protein
MALAIKLGRRFVARALAFTVGAASLGGVVLPAYAAKVTQSHRWSAEEETDRMLFSLTLSSFSGEWDLHQGEGPWKYALNWTSDQCSKSMDKPDGFDFVAACRRHDFGYRNYRAQERFTEDNRHRIDDNFKKDMYTVCAGYKGWRSWQGVSCRRWADSYHQFVRQFGNKKFPKI